MSRTSENLVPGEGLTIRQRQAAVLDAAGFKGPQIAQVLDIHVKTLGKWRQKDPQYQAAVAEYETRQVEELTPVIRRIQSEMALATLKAIRTINAAMDATTKAGTPSWAARLRAAADALNHSKLIAPATLEKGPEAANGAGGGGGTPSYAVIRVEVPGALTHTPDPKPIAAEAEAVEVEVEPERDPDD